MTEETLIDAVAEELAAVLGALLDVTGSVQDAAAPETPADVFVEMRLTGPASARLTIGLAGPDASRLAQAVVGDAGPNAGAAVGRTLQELCGQAVGALGRRDGFDGLRLAEATTLTNAPAGEVRTKRVVAGDRFDANVGFWVVIGPAGAVEPRPAANTGVPANLELILDIDLPLSVRFGETEMTLQNLTRLAPGSVIDLGRAPNDPVDVLVNGRLVARGEVVVVSGNYGVRIVEIVSAADRLRTVAA